MRKGNVLAIFALIIVILMMRCDMTYKTNKIQPSMETVQSIYIYEIVPIPVYKYNDIIHDIDHDETIETIYSDLPQEIDSNFDILKPCGYSYEQLLYSVSDEYRYEMVKHIDTFLEAEKKYGVNAFYLMCKMGLESGWARYPSGENNLGGWTNSDGTYMDFESEEDCILYIAEKLSTEYKDISGSRLEDVCQRYCPNSGYSETLIDIMVGRKEKIEELEV